MSEVSIVPHVVELPFTAPWIVAQRLAHWPHLVFLDSSLQHPTRGQYSYIAADPVVWLDDSPAPFEQFQRVTTECHLAAIPGLPPFQGGVAGMLGYGLNRTLERIQAMKHDDLKSPNYGMGIYDWVISFDHQQNRAWLVTTGFQPDGFFDEQRARQRARFVMDQIQKQGTVAPRSPKQQLPTIKQYPLPNHTSVTSNFSRDQYISTVRRAIEYIHAGDVFQVNIAQRLLAPQSTDSLTLYGKLRSVSPAPYACYLDLGEFQLVSASPEQFLQVSATGEVRTRPIKGTRPRGKTPEADAANLRDLTSNPKDRAENVMIVDLLRNDLGRVCEYGSVVVPKVCEVESYHYVHHLVSEVRGQLRAGLTPWHLLEAAFPGGSVTGAPKVRAMEIIAELEPTARGPYCGSVGFIGFNGYSDSNILIRTITSGRGWLQFPVGGGIVADSDPVREYDETLHKAAGMLLALQ